MSTLTVTVTAADGTSKQYTLPVTVTPRAIPGRTNPGTTTFPTR